MSVSPGSPKSRHFIGYSFILAGVVLVYEGKRGERAAMDAAMAGASKERLNTFVSFIGATSW
jgi:hypothetical protein